MNFVNLPGKLRCIPRIKQHYSLLSKAERRVADLVIQKGNQILNMSVAEIALECKTSQASVVRFCKSIGFGGVADFKQYLRHDEMSVVDERIWQSGGEEPLKEILQKVYLTNTSAITESLSVLDVEKVSKAAEWILSAHTIHIMGTGASATIAQTLQNGLLQMGLLSSFQTDPMNQMLAAANLGEEDVAIVINHSGRTKNVLEIMTVLKKQKVKVIAIVGIVGSEVDKLADISLYCGLTAENYVSDLMSARVSELNTVSMLYATLVYKGGERFKDFRGKNHQLMAPTRL